VYCVLYTTVCGGVGVVLLCIYIDIENGDTDMYINIENEDGGMNVYIDIENGDTDMNGDMLYVYRY
jgi:hypothetical protein